ncbi:MAG TPA: CBS domain-containing protein [Labilithrix sp.]|nr:CBS domain-containing protein [Labilithrix sp.]
MFFMTGDRLRPATRTRHPILRLEVLASDGTRTTDDRVFCRQRHRSVPVDTCTACFRCESILAAPEPAVHCAIVLGDAEREPDPLGSREAVGGILSSGTVALGPGNTMGEALRVLRGEDRRSVAIVDAKHSVVGVVHEGMLAATARRLGGLEGGAISAMSGAVVIHESVPVRRALGLLAAAHLREATVVDDEGLPIGVLHDVDALRWLIAARKRAGNHHTP